MSEFTAVLIEIDVAGYDRRIAAAPLRFERIGKLPDELLAGA
jgi:hypothetical protein